jgi:hypothetical protein
MSSTGPQGSAGTTSTVLLPVAVWRKPAWAEGGAISGRCLRLGCRGANGPAANDRRRGLDGVGDTTIGVARVAPSNASEVLAVTDPPYWM